MSKFNTETDARLQPGEDEGKLDCGCVLFYDESACACIRMCKLHKTAPKLLASLRDVVVWTQTHQRGECREADLAESLVDAEKLIAKLKVRHAG
jgi:hypothetical protein